MVCITVEDVDEKGEEDDYQRLQAISYKARGPRGFFKHKDEENQWARGLFFLAFTKTRPRISIGF